MTFHVKPVSCYQPARVESHMSHVHESLRQVGGMTPFPACPGVCQEVLPSGGSRH